MPNIKPLRKDYSSVKTLYASFNSVYKNMIYHACDGNGIFVVELSKVNWDSLSDSEVKNLIVLTLSYGLKTQENNFKPFITAQYPKPFSIFNSLLNHDIEHIKLILNDRNFQDIFTSLFMGDAIPANRVISRLKTRIGKMDSENQPTAAEIALLSALINSLLQGKNIARDGTVMETVEE